MSINPISSNLINLLSNEVINFDNDRTLDTSNSSNSFANILSEAFSTAEQADMADKASAIQLLMGQSDDLSGLLIDAQKAELSLNLALKLRNKVVDAYNEIMRMQV